MLLLQNVLLPHKRHLHLHSLLPENMQRIPPEPESPPVGLFSFFCHYPSLYYYYVHIIRVNYEKHAPRVSQVIATVAKVSCKHGLWLVVRVNKKVEVCQCFQSFHSFSFIYLINSLRVYFTIPTISFTFSKPFFFI